MGWTTDLFRIAWGLFFWNVRKTIFSARRSKSICPCQTRSDSGLAGETGCEPALLFEKPARFRQVCPLPKADKAGEFKCSVDTAQVRPFWGRFLVVYGGTIFLSYMLVAGSIFGVMRYIGYPISFSTIAWPPAWEKIDEARSQFFTRQAETAFARGDGSTALMALSLAYEYTPDNYDVGRLLAQFWSSSRPQHSDQIYEDLLTKHQDQRAATARAWVTGLLARGDFRKLERLAADALSFDQESTAAWLQSFLFANIRTKNNELLEELKTTSNPLPDGVQQILAMEQLVRSKTPLEAKEILSGLSGASEPNFVLHYRIQRLIQLGYQNRGLLLLNDSSDRFSNRDRIRLQLAAYAAGGFDNRYNDLMGSLVRLVPSLSQIEVLASHLLEYPNAQLYALLKQAVNPLDVFDEKERIQSLTAFYLIAVAHQDQSMQTEIIQSIQKLTGTPPLALLAISMAVKEPTRYRIQNVLPAIRPLSFDMTYAAWDWFEDLGQ